MQRIILDGDRIRNIASLYDELNRLFMTGEDWRLGPSLDALNDFLYGGIGSFPAGPVLLVWRDSAKSRAGLGQEETLRWLQDKLDAPGGFDRPLIAQQMAELKAGQGKTYFEIILEILADHPRITLREE